MESELGRRKDSPWFNLSATSTEQFAPIGYQDLQRIDVYKTPKSFPYLPVSKHKT
jgi:hypothetical protein